MLKLRFNKLGLFTKAIIAFSLTLVIFSLFSVKIASAQVGINRVINFQGKLVNNPAATNVSNTSYTVIFTIYDRNSGGTALWTETQSVTTSDGIFRVSLGSVTPFPSNFNFNWGGLYLGMKVNADSEMTPRIQLASVPFAFNAEKVAGLTVQDDSGNASTSGTLRVGNAKTVTFAGSNGLTFNDAGGLTTINFPAAGTITLVDTATSQTLTNKIIGSTGLTFTGAATDITTGTNQDFIISPNGSGLIGFNTNSPLTSSIDLRGNPVTGGTLSIASVSGKTSFATLVANNDGVGDLFTASASGWTRFVVKNNGQLFVPYYNVAGCTLKADTSGNISCGVDNIGGGSANWWNQLGGVLSPADTNFDFSIGGSSTASSKFSFTGVKTGQTIASVSGQFIVMPNNGFGGKVGIGTDTPGELLTVQGGNIRFNLNDLPGQAQQIESYNYNAGGPLVRAFIRFGSGPTYGDQGYLAFGTGNSVAALEKMRIDAIGNVGIGTTEPVATLDVRANSFRFANGGTLAVASVSGATSFATLVANNDGVGDLFTASASGWTRFVIKQTGNIGIGTNLPTAMLDVLGTASIGGQLSFRSGIAQVQATAYQTLTLGGDTTGKLVLSAYNGPTLSVGATGGVVLAGYTGSGTGCTLKTDSSGNVVCSTDNTGSSSGYSPFQELNGAIVANNTSMDYIVGGQSSASAKFQVTGNAFGAGTRFVASISGRTSYAALVIDNSGVGDLLAASVSGQARFSITNSGGINASDGLTINRLGTTDIVKTTSGNNAQDTDFQKTANATSATLTNVTSSNGDLSLDSGTVSSNGTITTSSQPTTAGSIAAGSHTISRPDGKYLVIRGGSTALDIFDSLSNLFSTTSQVLGAAAGAGALSIQRANGKYLVVHGGGVATTTVIDPMQQAATVAGPTTTTANGAGTNIFRRQNGQVLLIHGGAAGNTRIYNAVANSFAAGPTAASTTWGAGSLVLPRQNGTALIVTGGSSANTRLYNPYDGAASIGSFTAGPALPTNCEINGAGSVAMQLANGRYVILSKAGVSVEYDPVTNTMGSCKAVGPPAALADGAHAIRLQDRRFLILRGSGTTNAYIYDPETDTYSTHATSTSTMGAGLHSFQKADGTWQILVGGGTTTNNYNSQLVMNGSYVSEDINTTELNLTSTLLWSIGAESLFSGTSSATLNTPQSGVEFSVQTASTQGGLSSATARSIRKSGDLIGAQAGDSWIRITINFTRPIPSLLLYDMKTWTGNGTTTYIRDYSSPTVFDFTVDNSTLLRRNQWGFNDSQSSNDPFEASPSAITRLQAQSDKLTLPWGQITGPTKVNTNDFYTGAMGTHPTMLQPTGDGTIVIQRPGGMIAVIASGSANLSLYDSASQQFIAQSGAGNIPTNAVGAGAFALKLPNGKFLIIMGNAVGVGPSAITNIYDPDAPSGSRFKQGPSLAGNASYGATPIQNADGTYTIVHGGGLTTSTLFNPFTDLTRPAGTVLPTGPTLTTAANCGFWAIPLEGQMKGVYRAFVGVAPFATGANTTMMYDSYAKQFTAGANLTTVHGCGSYAFQRQDGWWATVAAAAGTTGAQTTTMNILNPWSNTTILGPAITGGVGRGSVVIPRADGTFLITRGQTQTINGNGVLIYVPWGGTFGVGAGIGTISTATSLLLVDYAGTPGTAVSGAGAVTFQRADGKWVIITGGHIGSAIVNIYDAGWFADGQYLSGSINLPQLSQDSALTWKKTADDYISFEVRTAPSKNALLVADYRDINPSDANIKAAAGDQWIQLQINFSRKFNTFSGVLQDVWLGRGAMYGMAISQPSLLEYKITKDKDLLTLKSNGLNVFRVSETGNIYSGQQGGFYASGADLAERYTSSQSLEKGEVVIIDQSDNHNVQRSSNQYQNTMLGVVSTDPGFVAGAYTEDSYPIALVGRVPVKVSNENGPINAGDYLTSGSIPGYAMKATLGGRVLGKALESFNPDLDTDKIVPCPTVGMGAVETTKCASIMLFVNLIDYQGAQVELLMQEQGFISFDNGLSLPNILLQSSQLTDAQKKQQEILAFLIGQKNSSITSEIYTGRVSAAKEVITPELVADLITAKTIRADRIEGLEIWTNQISSLKSQIANLDNATNSAVLGATASGVLDLQSLKVNGLTEISGDLTTKGNGLMEGMLTVIKSIATPNIVVSDFASFFGNVFFRGNTRFEGRPTFNNDTAGFAVINKGKTSVLVNFENEYTDMPIVTASIVLDKEQPTADTFLEEEILFGNLSYVITQRTTKGFVIKLNKPLDKDISFSWVALSIADVKTQNSNSASNANTAIDPSTTQSAAFQSVVSELNN